MRVDGYATLTDRETGKITGETDTRNCAHCSQIIHTPTNKKIEEVSDFCRNCMKIHCLKPACFTCTPFLKKIEAEEARYHARRSYGT